MPNIRSTNTIILDMIELLKILQPNATSVPGSVIRDLFVELPASQLSLLYDELANVSNLQSLRFVTGSDLDNLLLSNFGLGRKNPAKSSGVVLFTFSSLPTTVAINKNDLVFSSGGASFVVANGISVNPVNSNLYRSIATKFRNDLDFLNITDTFAVEVTVQATTPGKAGNISKYGIVKTNVPNVSHVTNIFSFVGGADQEDDPSYRNRGLAVFSGSNTGTTLGYKSTALTDGSVLDALVIGPGDPLMTRDGTIIVKNTDGSLTIVSEGTGGKVDIIILGDRLTEFTDSFIYQDKSNNNDPTDVKNIFVLGQIVGDENKSISRRRIDNIASGTLPAQPVNDILEVTGSLSGANFLPKVVDNLGRVSGNYELIKDAGSVSGSPFGFDKIRWVSNKISLFADDRVKGKFNGQDSLTFTDVLEIPKIQQNVPIANENSLVSSGDRSIIQLLHVPATNVTRVFNVNTGERYTITDQSVDSNDTLNQTGRIRITGNTLPSTSDILQVDYNWVVDFDAFTDFDGKIIKSNPRVANDSIDWGLANAIVDESVLFTKSPDGAFYSGSVKHPITSVLSANTFKEANVTVVKVLTGNFTGRLSVILSSLVGPVNSIANILLQNSNLEVYNTNDADGVLFNDRVVIGSNIRYNCIVILPTDTPTVNGQAVTAFFNQKDVFTVSTSVGNFSTNQITIPAGNFSIPDQTVVLRVNYLANIQDALTTNITSLPLSRVGNSFITNSSIGFTNSSSSNIIRRENQTVHLNISSQPFVKLTANVADFILTTSNVITVIKLANGLEVWNNDHVGVISTDVDGSYLLTFSGFNSPQNGNNVCVLYTTDDIKRAQPFTFTNDIVKKNIERLQLDPVSNRLFVDLQSFETESPVSFSIIDPATNGIMASGSATITAGGAQAALSNSIVIFDSIEEILLKKVRIKNAFFPNNNGLYDVVSINTIDNTITVNNNFTNLASNQISVIRLSDNQELWNSSGTINLVDNSLLLPIGTSANTNDTVIICLFVSTNLRQAPSRVSVTVADQINNSGIINIAGTTLTKVSEAAFTATSNGFKQNVAEAVRKSLGMLSTATLPSNISLARVTKLQKVTTTTGGEILSTDFTYNVLGTSIRENTLYADEMIKNDTLSSLDFIMPPTANNLTNQPKIGDKLKITFYYTTISDSESMFFTRNGTLYTNKKFAFIDKVYVSSGFASSSVRFIVSYFNQPVTGSRYKSFYDYTAPKQNERIVVRYNYNELIGDTTFNIENTRPINADVLIKAAKELQIDLTLNIVIKNDFLGSSANVLQNLKDKLTSAINTNKLGDILDASDLVVVAQGVDGVDRARVIYFNESGKIGQVLSLIAQRNQFFVANNIIINQETR